MPSPLTPAKLALLRVAKARLDLEDETYREILQAFGGSASAKDLGPTGFARVMDEFCRRGFVSDSRSDRASTRFGMATERQLELIGSLWREVASNPTDDHLTAWLEKTHKVSALRFLTSSKAGQVIAALKSWRGRAKTAAMSDQPDDQDKKPAALPDRFIYTDPRDLQIVSKGTGEVINFAPLAEKRAQERRDGKPPAK